MAKTILVADDSKTIRRVVEMTFEKTGFEVVTASNAHEALERAPYVEAAVVITDLEMPDGDGYSLCTTLKQQATTAHIPVLLLAGPSAPVDEAKAQLCRADGHIKKPFDSGDLIDLVRRVTGEAVEAQLPKSFAATLSQRTPDGVLTPQAPPPPPPASAAFEAPAAEPAMSADIPLVSEDIDLEEDVMIEELEPGEVPLGPSLEPPTPPTPASERAAVDMWALAEGNNGAAIEEIDIVDEPEELPMEAAVEVAPPVQAPSEDLLPPAPGTFSAPTRDVHDEDPTRDMSQIADVVVQTAAPAVAEVVAPAAPGLSKEELTAIAREVIEQIAWDVVPDLAETIIRAELKRLTAAD